MVAQTDGWLSEQSAKVYEVSTETLFLGRQDAMQRQTLVPLHKYVMSRPAGAAGLRALEIAAGTGRFATFIKVMILSKLLGSSHRGDVCVSVPSAPHQALKISCFLRRPWALCCAGSPYLKIDPQRPWNRV